MGELKNEGEASSSTGPHRMRITSGGQISGYVNFALTFLKENPDRALILHTLPPSNAESTNVPSDKSSSLNPALLATPKLVSVVEKIKREYMAYVNAESIGKGKNKAIGIWEYTESGTLEAGQEELGLSSILEGRTKPKMKHRPFLQITLSTKPLGLEEGVKGRNITCQYVMVRRKKEKFKTATSMGTGTAPVASKDEGSEEEEAAKVKGPKKVVKDKGEKRKSEGSQGSGPDSIRGGKKRKK